VIADLMWYREAGKYAEDQRRFDDQVDNGVASDHRCEAALAEGIDRCEYQPQYSGTGDPIDRVVEVRYSENARST